ncbi:MAG: hypothetical protein AB7J40_01720 [Candidatus Altimarinota bacterium]
MYTSFMLAKIIGPLYLVVGLGLYLDRSFYQKMYQEFMKSPALMYMGGLMALIIGALIVSVHNVWRFNWSFLITLIGWLGVLKGVGLIAFPNKTTELFKQWKVDKWIDKAFWGSLAIGLLLTYFGYFA